MKKKSIWENEIKNNYSNLREDINVDVLIIGGGITGISTAYHLKDSNLKICVVDRKYIASGVSCKTTGKLTYLQDLIYTKISDIYNNDVAKKYYESQKDAINLVEKIIKVNDIKCDYTKQKSYLFASHKWDKEKIKYEKRLLQSFGSTVNDVKKLPVNLFNYYGISVNDTAYFHSVKYINKLAEICFKSGVRIYEKTNIIDFKENEIGYICYTEKNKIFAKKLVIACHYPFFLFSYFFPIKGHLEQSYIGAGEVSEKKNVSGINVSKSSKSFRYHSNGEKNYLIYLNRTHNLANKFNINNNFENLLEDFKKLNLFPQFIWSNVDIITNDYLPYIGKLKKDMYIATGYNTWGMTNGSLAGLIISDLILNRENKYISLFNPYRKLPISASIYDVYSSAKPFVENKIIKNKPFYKNNVIFTKKDGKNIGIYIDSDGEEHIVYNKCPHLKCSLIFNEVELTWDCPCHSSRFDIDGNCIKGPSKYNIAYKKNNGE